ncbi:InlB B-repeat-containing protein [Anaerotruncus rubiinfantis]|uniref:InlB B-repeat-containing protein n=1 Tax=Anaerotruncus rubiinfantis TaxID=1720200 RepID=UPI00082F648C|nr:InlB B-repeat-containing protein [Anaerotruncus rubiinfantis]
MKRKLLSLLLAAVMVATVFNSVALAAETEENEKEIPQAACELCGHIHDENCGYIASVEGVPCSHIHDDACGFTEGAQSIPCSHEHTEECYQLVTNCVHEHTDACYPVLDSVDTQAPADTAPGDEGEMEAPMDTASGDAEAAETPVEGDAAGETLSLPVEEGVETPSAPEDEEEAISVLNDEGAAPEPTECTHECTEENGCIAKELACPHEHDAACGYIPGEGTPCNHVHDENCGYVAPAEGADCTHVCSAAGIPAALINPIGGNNGAEHLVSSEAEMKDILGNSETNVVIRVKGTIEMSPISIPAGKQVALMPADGEDSCLISKGHKMITIASGATLTLAGSGTNTLTIDGENTYGQLVYVEGTLVMEDGSAVTRGFYDTSSDICYGGGIYVAEDGSFVMNGGEVSNSSAEQGGGVAVRNGIFKMSGGKIIDNNNPRNNEKGGGVYVDGEKGSLQLSGNALIQGNTANDGDGPVGAGGGVYICDGAAFEMTGGTITKNKVENGSGDCYGGGVAIRNATGVISGGTISSNEASTCGGGISCSSGGGFTPTDGYTGEAILTITGDAKIINNTAGANDQTSAMRGGGGIYNCGTLNVEGGVISGNKAYCGGGIANQGHSSSSESGTLNLTGGEIRGNTAETGGGIGNEQTVHIAGGTISGNTATKAGSGIYQDGNLGLSSAPVWGEDDDIALVDYYHYKYGLRYKTTISKAGDFTFAGRLPVTLYSTSKDADKTAEQVGRNLVETYLADVSPADLQKFDVRTKGDFTAVYTETDAEQQSPVVPVLELAQGVKYQVEYYYQSSDGSYAALPTETKTFSGPLGMYTITPEEVVTYDGVQYSFDQTNANNVLSLELTNPMPAGSVFKVYYEIDTPKYTVAYDANGGSGTAPAEPAEYAEGEIVTVFENTFTYEGMSFTGWKDGEGNDYTVGSTFTMPAKDVALFAQWESNSGGGGGGSSNGGNGGGGNSGGGGDDDTYYTLIFRTNGGSPISSRRVTEYTTVRLTQRPTKDSYTFEGWYADQALTQKISSVYMDRDKTVYAKWTQGTTFPLDPNRPADPAKPGTPAGPGAAPNPKPLPDTGASSMSGLWLAVSVLSGAGLVWINRKKRCR